MSLNSVQQYVKSILDGLALPTYQAPLRAYIAPPVPDQQVEPRCYIWGARFQEARQTAPRGPAFKKVTYDLDLYCFVIDDPNSPGVDSRFPVLIDTVQQALRVTTMPIVITDSVTGVSSQVLSVGERFEVRYDTERTLADQRYVRFLALITAYIEEAITA